MPIVENEYQLSLLCEGAVIRDRMGDVWQLRGEDMWCSFETTPMDSRSIARWLPAEVLLSEHSLEQSRDYRDAPAIESHVQVASITALPIDAVATMLRAGWTLVTEIGKPHRWERQFVNTASIGRTARYRPANEVEAGRVALRAFVPRSGRTDVLGADAAGESGYTEAADRG